MTTIFDAMALLTLGYIIGQMTLMYALKKGAKGESAPIIPYKPSRPSDLIDFQSMISNLFLLLAVICLAVIFGSAIGLILFRPQ